MRPDSVSDAVVVAAVLAGKKDTTGESNVSDWKPVPMRPLSSATERVMSCPMFCTVWHETTDVDVHEVDVHPASAMSASVVVKSLRPKLSPEIVTYKPVDCGALGRAAFEMVGASNVKTEVNDPTTAPTVTAAARLCPVLLRAAAGALHSTVVAVDQDVVAH